MWYICYTKHHYDQSFSSLTQPSWNLGIFPKTPLAAVVENIHIQALDDDSSREPLFKMVFCTYCGQSFTRDEHLERHILTRKCTTMPVVSTLQVTNLLPLHRHKCKTFQMLHLSYELCSPVRSPKVLLLLFPAFKAPKDVDLLTSIRVIVTFSNATTPYTDETRTTKRAYHQVLA